MMRQYGWLGVLLFAVSMGFWCLCATSLGPNSRRIRVASECHFHVFHPDHIISRTAAGRCMVGTWTCVPTREVQRGEAAYELSRTTGIHPGVPYWRLSGDSCDAFRPTGLSTAGEPEPPESDTDYRVSPHPNDALTWEAGLRDIFSPREVFFDLGIRMQGGAWSTYGRTTCDDLPEWSYYRGAYVGDAGHASGSDRPNAPTH